MKATVGFAFACLVVSLGLGCGGSSKPPTTKCVHSSECGGNGLVCSLGYCVSACVTSADCLKGERCIITMFEGTDGGTGTGTACQAPETNHCQYNSQCASPLLCGVDQQCRNQCQQDVDCPMKQKCTSVSHLCVDPIVDVDVYDPVTNELRPANDGGGQDGGGGSGDGSTDLPQSLDGAGGASGGGGGTVVNTCPSPQTTFGNIAQGDANPLFASSVGARTASRFYVFSGYRGPAPGADPDAGAPPTENYIYLQSFDPVSGASLGAAAPFVHVADDQYFYLQSGAVAPTGEIAVVHSTGTPTDGAQTNVYVSFFNAPVPSDGGAPGALRFVKTVQIESTHIVGTPRVIWSVANGAFVVSWKSSTTAWYVHVRKFFPNGSAAGGGTNNVPTPTGLYGNVYDGQAATSGAFVAVSYRNMGDDFPWLTILDDQGQQVGASIVLGTPTVVTWTSTGGTTRGFVGVWQNGANMYGTFVPITATGAVVSAAADGGVDAGTPPFATFMIPTASGIQPHLVSDDTGGPGGVGLLLLEPNGASFTYVNADASKRLGAGVVLTSSNAGNQISLTNYRGSFGVTLFDGVKHSTQMVASGCPQ